LAALNGTSIVGWNNFFGLDRRKHQILSATLGFEFIGQRPGGLRLLATDKAQRLKLEGGFTRSLFSNPSDPLLNLNQPVVPVKEMTRSAYYLDTSYALLHNLKLRAGINTNWRMTRRMTINVIASNTLAGDLARRITRSRSTEFDVQWSYQFTHGEAGWRKVKGQFFIRYADRYARTRDLIFGLDNLTRLKTLNGGINFVFF
jgi:hypothetical protein